MTSFWRWLWNALSDVTAWIFAFIIIIISLTITALVIVGVVLFEIVPFPWVIIVEVLWLIFCALVILYIVYKITRR